MGTKLLIQRVSEWDPSSPRSKIYLSLLKRVVELVKDKDTEVKIRFLKKGMTDPNAFPYSFLHFINDREVVEAILEAGKEGHALYKFPEPIAYLSKDEPIYPGEFICSGTVGPGCGLEHGKWPKPRDIVGLDVEGIGVLRNKVEQRD